MLSLPVWIECSKFRLQAAKVDAAGRVLSTHWAVSLWLWLYVERNLVILISLPLSLKDTSSMKAWIKTKPRPTPSL